MVSWTWTFATLVGLIARASVTKPNYEIDGQQVAIAALCVLPIPMLFPCPYLLLTLCCVLLAPGSSRFSQLRSS